MDGGVYIFPLSLFLYFFISFISLFPCFSISSLYFSDTPRYWCELFDVYVKKRASTVCIDM